MTTRNRILLCALFVCLLVLCGQANASNPILVVTKTTSPFTTYLPEILRAEGVNAFDVADLSLVTSSKLSGYDVVILGEMPLTATQVTTFTTWVNGGGNLIAMRPDTQLKTLLGLAGPSGTMADAYLLVNTAAKPGRGIVNDTIQYHGTADLYALNGATAIATLYSSSTSGTTYPAVISRAVGSGQVAAFTYDLARSIVYTRQGNPAWAATKRDADGGPIRSDDLFFGDSATDPKPDWVDLSKVQIPQADEQQRLLVNIILNMNAAKTPIPRFWYLPKGVKAAVVMTGDDHGTGGTGPRFDQFIAASPANCSVVDWECIRSTSYVYPNTTIDNPAGYAASGFEIALHITTDCNDFTGFSNLDSYYQTQLSQWTAAFPELTAPVSNRTHCVVWSDYDTQPKVELSHGMRLDTTYYYYPGSWVNDKPGLFTGSGMPMRFMTAAGSVVDVYQATSQMTDESNQTYPFTFDTLLNNAMGPQGYFGVFTANMHTDFGTTNADTWSGEIVSAAKAAGVPVVSSAQMLQWLDGRNNSTFVITNFNNSKLNFSITLGTAARNLKAMLPANAGGLGLASIKNTTANTTVPFTLQMIKGVQYAVFSAAAASFQATYSGSPSYSIGGALSPLWWVPGTSVAITGPANASTTIDQYGSFNFVGLPAGTYTVTPTNANGTFSPAIQPVTLGPDNADHVDFSFIQRCPCSIWNNSSVPMVVSADDPSSVELGVRFTSDVNGTITGIRFYKGSTNTGTHTGSLWSNAGTLLAAATFTNETASGWQQVNFSQPVLISANTTYVASYHTDAGNYSVDPDYFATTLDSLPLHALANGFDGLNGVYRYGASAFPDSSFQNSNYWVDVVLATTASPRTISGTISGPASAGTTVTLTGAATATTTTDGFGNYSFAGLSNGSYTVTPTKTGFTFSPTNRSVTISGASVSGVNFSSAAQTFSVTGTISGAGGNGATVTLSGAGSATTTADASGNYAFTGLVNGSYTVTPTKTGFDFTPVNQSVTIAGSSVTGVNFSSAAQTYSISGTISGAGGNGATVTLSGAASAATTADGSGNYTFTGLSNGSYTVTPTKIGFNFTPANQAVTIAGASTSGVNFSSTAQTYSITGSISGVGGNSATVTLGGAGSATTTADASGNYAFTGLLNGSYTVTPTKIGFNFTPTSQNVTISNATVTGVNFSSVAQTYSISGAISGTGGNGATVTLSGAASAVTTADVSGNYSFSGLSNGGYTVSASNAGYDFSPVSQNVTLNFLSVSGVNFVSTLQTFSISGTITGPGAVGATVSLTGASSATTTSDASGNFTFAGVISGSYTVTASKDGYAYTPVSQNVVVSGASVLNTNFSSVSSPTETTPFHDDFNRTVIGSNYTIASGDFFGAPVLNGTTFGGDPAMNTIALVSPSAATIGSNQFARVTMVNETTTGGSSLFLRATLLTDKSDLDTGYELDFGKLANGGSWWTLWYKDANGFNLVQDTPSSTHLISAGSVVEFHVSGNTLQVVINGQLEWTGLYSGVTTGTPGIGVYGNATLDEFFAGNYSSMPTTYTLGGTVSGPGANLATVTLSGAATSSTITDGSGNYSFVGVPNGSYTVAVAKAGFNFTPASQNVTISGVSVTNVNFGSVATYTVGGIISGPGGNGATVALSGDATTTTTADSSGNFAFAGLLDGNYTVTASKDGYAYTPVSQNVVVSGASVLNTNFSSVSSPTETTPFHDDFNRTVIGSNYTIASGDFFGAPVLNGTTFGGDPAMNTIALVSPSAATIGSNQFARVTMVNETTTGGSSLFLRATLLTDKSDLDTGYELDFGKLANGGSWWTLWYKDANGFNLVQDTPSSTHLISAGSVVEFHVSGNTLQVVINGQLEWTGLYSGVTTGTPGIGVYGNATLDEFFAGNYSSMPTTYTLGGTVSGPGANLATVTLSGAATSSTITDGSGNYSFVGVPNGSYTVAVAKAGFNFTPASQNVTISGVSVTNVNFGSVATYTVGGIISGPGGNGATVALSGDATTTTTADSSGNFAFAGLLDGNYTVTASKDGYAYTPVSQNVVVSGASVLNTNFSSVSSPTETTPFHDDFNRTVIGSNYTIASGDFFGAPVLNGTTFGGDPAMNTIALVSPSAATIGSNQFARVTMVNETTTGGSSLFLRATLLTDKSDLDTGYELDFGKLANGGSWWTLWYKDANGFNLVQDTPSSTHLISAGSVVEFHVSGNTLQVVINGQLEWTGLYSGVTTGTPGIGVYGNATLDEFFAGNYSSMPTTYTLGGTVSGPGANLATVTLSGAATSSTITDGSGNYSFVGVPNGSYTVAVAKAGFNFTPASQNVTISGVSVTNVNFGSVATYTVGGTISGPGGNGATVSLSGDATASTTADSSGNYTFNGVADGNYTITPTKTAYVFTPAGLSLTVSGAAVTGKDFSSTFVPTAAVPFHDDFNRTVIGSNYTNAIGDYFGAPVLNGSTFGGDAMLNTVSVISPSAATIGADQFARATMVNGTLNGGSSLFLRATLLGDKSDLDTGYELDFGKLANGGSWWTIWYKDANGYNLVQDTPSSTYVINVGSVVEFRAVGSTLEVLINGQVEWTGANSGVMTGTPGLGVYGNARLDEFFAGNQ